MRIDALDDCNRLVDDAHVLLRCPWGHVISEHAPELVRRGMTNGRSCRNHARYAAKLRESVHVMERTAPRIRSNLLRNSENDARWTSNPGIARECSSKATARWMLLCPCSQCVRNKMRRGEDMVKMWDVESASVRLECCSVIRKGNVSRARYEDRHARVGGSRCISEWRHVVWPF